jgi:hypothetical protein
MRINAGLTVLLTILQTVKIIPLNPDHQIGENTIRVPEIINSLSVCYYCYGAQVVFTGNRIRQLNQEFTQPMNTMPLKC